jgi:tetratricopeptide (TPR) repeat protein
LIRLGRLDDAQQVLEASLRVFQDAGDAMAQSTALFALADLWDERGDQTQAIALGRQALAVRNHLPDPMDRASSHANLGKYLETTGQTQASQAHQVADAAYLLLTGHGQHLATWLDNLKIRRRRAAETGDEVLLPPLAEVLNQPEFEPLARFLAQNGVEPAGVQAQIDALLDQARQSVATD